MDVKQNGRKISRSEKVVLWDMAFTRELHCTAPPEHPVLASKPPILTFDWGIEAVVHTPIKKGCFGGAGRQTFRKR